MDAEYMAEYRRSNPDYAGENKLRNRARARALTELSKRFPVDYQRILAEKVRELRKERANGTNT